MGSTQHELAVSLRADRTGRVELIRTSLQTWRSSLGGGAALVPIVAAGFSAFSPDGHLMAAMSCGMAMMGAASSVTSMELLLPIALPSLLLAPAVLVWHAGLLLAGGVALTLG